MISVRRSFSQTSRGRPGARLVPAHAPVLVPGRGVEGGDVRLLGVVVHHEYLVVEQRRGGPGSPAPSVRSEGDVPGPDQVAVEVVGVQAHVPEQGVHPLAVGHRRRRSERVLRMDARPDRPFVRRPLPEHFAAVKVQTEHRPAVGARLHAVDGRQAAFRQVQARLRSFIVVFGDNRREEDPAFPDDRTRPTQARNRRLPRHVLGGAPGFRQPRIVGHDRRPVRPAELRPVVGLRRRGRMQRDQRSQQHQRREPQSSPLPHDIPLYSLFATRGNGPVHHARHRRVNTRSHVCAIGEARRSHERGAELAQVQAGVAVSATRAIASSFSRISASISAIGMCSTNS